jgi:hypothetical protein
MFLFCYFCSVCLTIIILNFFLSVALYSCQPTEQTIMKKKQQTDFLSFFLLFYFCCPLTTFVCLSFSLGKHTHTHAHTHTFNTLKLKLTEGPNVAFGRRRGVCVCVCEREREREREEEMWQTRAASWVIDLLGPDLCFFFLIFVRSFFSLVILSPSANWDQKLLGLLLLL